MVSCYFGRHESQRHVLTLLGTAYKNCEFRSFVFTDESNEKEAHLVQVGKSGPKGVRPPGSHTNAIAGAEN